MVGNLKEGHQFPTLPLNNPWTYPSPLKAIIMITPNLTTGRFQDNFPWSKSSTFFNKPAQKKSLKWYLSASQLQMSWTISEKTGKPSTNSISKQSFLASTC